MPGCAVERGARLGPVPLHDVEDARRQPGLVGDVGEQRGGQRRPLRRLDHDRVAGRERRADPPGRQHQRRVPGRDDRGDPGRVVGDPLAVPADLAVRTVQLAAASRRRSGSSCPRAASRCGGASAAASRCRGSRRRRGPRPGFDAVGHTVQDVGPLARGQCRPGREGRRGPPPRRHRPRRRRRRRSRRWAVSSIGEMSVNVDADATRRPPIQCRVSTSTPSTVIWLPGSSASARGAVRSRRPTIRSDPNDLTCRVRRSSVPAGPGRHRRPTSRRPDGSNRR